MIPGSDFAGLIVLGGETQQEGLRRDGGGGGREMMLLKCEHLSTFEIH